MSEKTYTPGCTYIVYTKEELNEMRQNGGFLIIKTYYKKWPWYKFWKVKEIDYYEVMCMR